MSNIIWYCVHCDERDVLDVCNKLKNVRLPVVTRANPQPHRAPTLYTVWTCSTSERTTIVLGLVIDQSITPVSEFQTLEAAYKAHPWDKMSIAKLMEIA